MQEVKKWPRVKASSKLAHLRRVGTKRDRKRDKWVNMKVGWTRMLLYADTGSKFTIITPEQYREDMGEGVAADTSLRAWGPGDTWPCRAALRQEVPHQAARHQDKPLR